jgi:hypothetical protein
MTDRHRVLTVFGPPPSASVAATDDGKSRDRSVYQGSLGMRPLANAPFPPVTVTAPAPDPSRPVGRNGIRRAPSPVRRAPSPVRQSRPSSRAGDRRSRARSPETPLNERESMRSATTAAWTTRARGRGPPTPDHSSDYDYEQDDLGPPYRAGYRTDRVLERAGRGNERRNYDYGQDDSDESI